MLRFAKIPAQAFDVMQLDSGVLLYTFDPAAPAEPDDDAVICATKGGVTVTCVPKYTDMGTQTENCPAGTTELKKLTGWSCGMKFVSLGITADNLRLALGAADADGIRVTPRRYLTEGDCRDIWWVGDMSGGGMAAVRLMNALSEEGLTLRSTPGGRGQLAVSLAGHISVFAPDTVPIAFYAAA